MRRLPAQHTAGAAGHRPVSAGCAAAAGIAHFGDAQGASGGRTLCFACKYMYCDWDAEPCLTCLRHTLAEAGQADAFEQDQTEKDRLL